VRRLHRARGAGGAGGHGHAHEVERHEQAFGLDPAEGDVGRVGHARPVAVAHGAGQRQQALLQPVTQRRQARGRGGQLGPGQARGLAQARDAGHVLRARAPVALL
jgi:hypothetical protein